MLIWLTICNSVAAVRAGPVSPNGNVVPSPTAQDTNLTGNFKYCRCVDGQRNGLSTPTNDVYQGYLQSLGNGVNLSYDSSGAPVVSYSVFIISGFQPPVPPHHFFPLLSG